MEQWDYSSYKEFINQNELNSVNTPEHSTLAGKPFTNICTKEVAYELLDIPKEHNLFIKQSYGVIINNTVILSLSRLTT